MFLDRRYNVISIPLEFNKEWMNRKVKLPTVQDQKGAIGGILRLQRFYKIKARNISSGT